MTLAPLVQSIKQWAIDLGFSQIGITNTDLTQATARYKAWLARGYHGEMGFLKKHGEKRFKPESLIPGTLRVICVRMDYLPPDARIKETLKNPQKAYIARYALGRDYHKLIRKRLQKLADKIMQEVESAGFRAFVDSGPVLEKPLAEKAGLGWIGKHTNLIHSKSGSYFFLGELYTDLPLPLDEPHQKNHCGRCQACISICPTQAIIAPYQLDARRCISYLTIEFRGSIPLKLRPLIGNRIFGCDDCQLICPWNRFAKITKIPEFHVRHQLNNCDLVRLFLWSESDFRHTTEGSALKRVTYECWLRNIAVALGNAPSTPEVIEALKYRLSFSSKLVKEHVQWALAQHNI